MKKKKKKKEDPKFWFEDEYIGAEPRMLKEMDRVMGNMWRGPFGFRIGMRRPKIDVKMIRGFPVDISESDKEIFIKADLPGFEKDEVKVNVTSRMIRITAQKKKQVVEKDKTYYRQERSFGSAQRVLSLPAEVDPDRVKAKFEKGVLEITLPKIKGKKKTTEIRIQ